MGLVKIRLSGDRADIEVVIKFLFDAEAVMKFPKLLSKSKYYPNGNDSGVRCHLHFFVDREGVVQEPTLVKPELPQDSDR